MRQCLFCDSSANSKEDAWPRWLTRRFAGVGEQPIEAEIRGVALPPRSSRRPALSVRRVCRRCNNGWMSALENRAKPILEPLLDGQPTVLDLAARTSIAVWATKIAMVLEGVEADEMRMYSQSERVQLKTLSVIPRGTSVWIARALHPTYVLSVKTRHRGPEGSAAEAHVTTLAFGLLAFQVATVRLPLVAEMVMRVTTDVRAGPWDTATVRLWPEFSGFVSWPPEVALNGIAGLDALAERFKTVGLSPDEVLALAV